MSTPLLELAKGGAAAIPEIFKEGPRITSDETNPINAGGNVAHSDQFVTGVNVYVPSLIGNSGEIAKHFIEGSEANGGFGFVHPSRLFGDNGTPDDDTFQAQSLQQAQGGPNYLLFGGIGLAAVAGYFVVRRFL